MKGLENVLKFEPREVTESLGNNRVEKGKFPRGYFGPENMGMIGLSPVFVEPEMRFERKRRNSGTRKYVMAVVAAAALAGFAAVHTLEFNELNERQIYVPSIGSVSLGDYFPFK